MKNCFALIHTWPELRNAEYEVVQRIVAAAENAGRGIAVIDNGGAVVWASPHLGFAEGSRIDAEAIDFVISLHFESPRVIDCYSYYAIWQPLDFYDNFGYLRSVGRAASHNDGLSCHSPVADGHFRNLLAGYGRDPAPDFPTLFHMLPQPYLAPNVREESRLCYVGINWERIGRSRGRFHETLTMLDGHDLVDIYGPRLILGVAPWEGFASYRGELPFDGVSVRNAINRSGICLALSSASHKSSGIMSNRLFEGIAGGAAVIATPHPIIDRYFAGMVYVVDDTRGETVLEQQIVETLRAIRADPVAANQRVAAAQEVLRERCSLEGAIDRLYAGHASRVAWFDERCLDDCEVTLVLDVIGLDADSARAAAIRLRAQRRCRIDLRILCNTATAGALERQRDRIGGGAIASLTIAAAPFLPVAATLDGIKPPPARSGEMVAAMLADATTEFVAFLDGDDELFCDHFASLARAMRAEEGARVAAAGVLGGHRDPGGLDRRVLHDLVIADPDQLLMIDGAAEAGRYLFDRSLVPPLIQTLRAMDGEEVRLFQVAAMLAGPLAQSGYATFVANDRPRESRRTTPTRDQQRQIVRDRFAVSAAWRTRTCTRTAPADDSGQVRTVDDEDAMQLQVNRTYVVGSATEGVAMLGRGFARPELDHVWVTGERATVVFAWHDSRDLDVDYDLVLVMLGLRAQDSGRPQHCHFLLNDVPFAYLPVPDHETVLSFRLPPAMRRSTNRYRLEIVPDHRAPPRGPGGEVVDSRPLSVMLRSVALVRRDEDALPILRIGEHYPCQAGAAVTKGLREGFYAPEDNLVWMLGTEASVAFRLAAPARAPVLALEVLVRRSASGGDPQRIGVLINGSLAGFVDVGEGRHMVRLPLVAASLDRGLVALHLRLSYADPVTDEGGVIVDGRLLGMALVSIGIEDGAEGLDVSDTVNAVDTTDDEVSS